MKGLARAHPTMCPTESTLVMRMFHELRIIVLRTTAIRIVIAKHGHNTVRHAIVFACVKWTLETHLLYGVPVSASALQTKRKALRIIILSGNEQRPNPRATPAGQRRLYICLHQQYQS